MKVLKLGAKILAALVIAIAVLIGTAAVYRTWRQHEGEKRLAITSDTGIDEAMFVKVRGSEQWITIRGRDRSNPVVLVVHGGPGVALSPLATQFLVYENDYTIVQWDQPGSARTLSRAGGRIPPDLSIADIAADGIGVAEFVESRLGKQKIILVGLSWGSVIGIEMARTRPDLFVAYVGTGLFVNKQDGIAVAYANVLAKARERNNPEGIAELVAIGPPPYDTPDEARTESKWAAQLAGQPSAVAAAVERLKALLLAPRYTLTDVRSYLDGYTASDEQFDLGTVDLRTGGLTFELPIFVFQGEDDFLTPAELARTYFDRITAPRREFLLIKGGGHTALIDDAEQFLAALNQRVRPLAFADAALSSD